MTAGSVEDKDLSDKMKEMEAAIMVPKAARFALKRSKSLNHAGWHGSDLDSQRDDSSQAIGASQEAYNAAMKQISALLETVDHLESENIALRQDNSVLKDREVRSPSQAATASPSSRGLAHLPDTGDSANALKASNARCQALQSKLDGLEHVRSRERESYELRIRDLEKKLGTAEQNKELLVEDNYLLTLEVEDLETQGYDPIAQGNRDNNIKAMVKDEMAQVWNRFDAQLRQAEEQLARDAPNEKPSSTWQYSSPHDKRLHRMPALKSRTESQSFDSHLSRSSHSPIRSPPPTSPTKSRLSPASRLGVLNLPSRS